MGLNLGLCGKWLESIQLSSVRDFDLSGISVMDININDVSIEMNCQKKHCLH
jgi:hypothetical protein